MAVSCTIIRDLAFRVGLRCSAHRHGGRRRAVELGRIRVMRREGKIDNTVGDLDVTMHCVHLAFRTVRVLFLHGLLQSGKLGRPTCH